MRSDALVWIDRRLAASAIYECSTDAGRTWTRVTLDEYRERRTDAGVSDQCDHRFSGWSVASLRGRVRFGR